MGVGAGVEVGGWPVSQESILYLGAQSAQSTVILKSPSEPIVRT